MMTAQERKDFRRVQASRETWKKRAGRRGEASRRFKERRPEVDRSRQGWRNRALAAEHRVDQLAIEHSQLTSALTRAPEPSTIDNTHFLRYVSLHLVLNCTLSFRASRNVLRSLLLAGADEIYRCTVNGKIVFTDEPCGGKPVGLLPTNSLPAAEALPKENIEKPRYNSSKWYINARGYKSALKVSEQYDAPLLIYYHADWCGYCRQLERELLNTSAAKRSLRHVVKVRISPEDGDRENTLFERMGGTGYPTILTQKSASAPPVKRRLMRKINNQWRTKSTAKFNQLIERLSR